MSTPLSSRRDFLVTSALAAGALALPSKMSLAASARVLGANDRVNLAVIGTGGMGTGHLGAIVELTFLAVLTGITIAGALA